MRGSSLTFACLALVGCNSDRGGSACRETIDTFCASDASDPLYSNFGPCVRDWPTAAKNAAQLCSGGGFANQVSVYPHCDGFNLIAVGYTDTSTFYYYDPVTLKLVRVEGHGLAGTDCVAGQAGPFVPLTDCLDGASPTSICVDDAASD